MNNNLLHENQFGFQINNSTEHAILQFTRDIVQNFDNGKFTLGVFIDLSKAFDTVNHQILLKKLKHGVNEKTLAWHRSYLLQRKQYIENSNDTSNIYLKLIVVSCMGFVKSTDHFLTDPPTTDPIITDPTDKIVFQRLDK